MAMDSTNQFLALTAFVYSFIHLVWNCTDPVGRRLTLARRRRT